MTVLRRICPAGCGRTVAPRKLMCPGCWSQVPRQLQNEVYRTYRAWWSDRGNADKFAAYDAAQEAAVKAVG